MIMADESAVLIERQGNVALISFNRPERLNAWSKDLGAALLGRLREAEAGCRQLLSIDPNQPDALHLLGVIAIRCNQPAAGAELLRRAISIDAQNAEFHFHLANAYWKMARPAESAAGFAHRYSPAMDRRLHLPTRLPRPCNPSSE